MSIPGLIMWATVLLIGVPSAWRNPTAAALVGAWIVTKTIYLATGNGLAIDYYIFPDIAVLAVIFAKREFCNLRPYRSTIHQLKCVLLERSPADRAVMLIYPLEWTIYCSSLHGYYVWWLLWGLSILQFLAAAAEALHDFWRSRSMPRGEAERGGGGSTDGNGFVEIPVVAKAFLTDFDCPALVSFAPPNARFAASVVDPLFRVPLICLVVAISQISNAIVRWFAVDVVDAFRRPSTVENRPRHAMSECKVTDHVDAVAPERIRREGAFLASISSVPGSINSVAAEKATVSAQPKQFARLRLIAEKLTKRFRGGYFSGSHCEDTFRSGQGRALFAQRSRPAFASTNHTPTQRRVADADAMLVACGGRGSG